MTVYVDTDHAHDLVTRRSIMGIRLMMNNSPVKWVSKCQKAVETSTYGSQRVSGSLGVKNQTTELILQVRFMLRSFRWTKVDVRRR